MPDAALRILALSAALAACAFGLLPVDARASEAGDKAAVEKAMRAYDAALCLGKPEAVAACYTPDGALLLPSMAPLSGPAAIKAFLVPMVASAEVASVNTTTDLLDVHGATADQWGTYREVAGERGKPMGTFGGRYAALWHRGSDGQWRLARLMMQPVPVADAAPGASGGSTGQANKQP